MSALAEALSEVAAEVAKQFFPPLHAIDDRLAKVEEALGQRIHGEWERLADALKARRVSRSTIMREVAAGRLTHRREPCPGGEAYLLRRAELDARWPVSDKRDHKGK